EDGGRLSAELQRHPLHGRRTVTHDALADRDRSRERNLVDIRVSDEFGADGASATNHDVADALWKPRRIDALEHHPGLQRTELAGLDDDGTPCRNSRRKLEADEQRIGVPRSDQT